MIPHLKSVDFDKLHPNKGLISRWNLRRFRRSSRNCPPATLLSNPWQPLSLLWTWSFSGSGSSVLFLENNGLMLNLYSPCNLILKFLLFLFVLTSISWLIQIRLNRLDHKLVYFGEIPLNFRWETHFASLRAGFLSRPEDSFVLYKKIFQPDASWSKSLRKFRLFSR